MNRMMAILIVAPCPFVRRPLDNLAEILVALTVKQIQSSAAGKFCLEPANHEIKMRCG